MQEALFKSQGMLKLRIIPFIRIKVLVWSSSLRSDIIGRN